MGTAARFDLGGVEPRAARAQGVDYRGEGGETLERVGAHARGERITAPEDVGLVSSCRMRAWSGGGRVHFSVVTDPVPHPT